MPCTELPRLHNATRLLTHVQELNTLRSQFKDIPDKQPYEAVLPANVKCYNVLLREAGYYYIENEKTDYQFKAPLSTLDECSKTYQWENRPVSSPFFAIFNIMSSHESQITYRKNSPISYYDEDVIVPPYYPEDSVIRRDITRNYSNITVMDREAGEMKATMKTFAPVSSVVYQINGKGLTIKH